MKRFDLFEHHYVLSQLKSMNIQAHCNALNLQKQKTNLSKADIQDINDSHELTDSDTSGVKDKDDSGVELPPEPSKKRRKPSTLHEVRPSNEIRYDNIGHLPHIDDFLSPTRCKLEGCKLKSHYFCDKCKVHLCLKLDNNCYLKFHTGTHHE